MSKSFKKHPALSGMNVKGMKKCANKRVRRSLKNFSFSLTGKEYKKMFPSYDIRDYSEVAPSKKTFIEREKQFHYLCSYYWIKKLGRAPTDEELIEYYNKWYVRK